MPRVTYTADGGTYRVGGVGFEPGDTKDVDTELADYLADRDDFALEDTADTTEEDDVDEESADEDDVAICGAEMSGGDTCERPADECPYHDTTEEDDVDEAEE